MKTRLSIVLLSLLTFSLTSCFDDDGNYTYHDVDEITISGIQESYANISYSGEVLEIDPVVESNYTDLKYEWSIWEPSKEFGTNGNRTDDTYASEVIGTEKKLTYPVECPIGRYTIKLKVYSESTGYFATASTRFDVGSEFTRGFYILKETADGNTDFDLYVNEDTPIKENILTLTGQESLKGKPLFISNVASHGYLDEAGDYQGAHTICVTTEEGDLGFYDTNSMLKIHDRSDVLNGGMAADEKPYTAFSFGASNFFLSSKGTYMSYVYAMMPTSGTFQMHGTGTNGGSQFVCSDGSSNVFFWDEQNQCVNVSENIQFGQVFGTYNNNGFSTEGLTCLSCGSNLAVNNAYFILESADGKRYLHEVSMSGTDGYFKATRHMELEPGSKLANATEFAVNELTASYMYFVYNNQVYVYNLTNYTEEDTPLTLEGIPSDETITYLSYQWQNFNGDADYNFTHLVVGTQKGDAYRLYMYDLEIGRPSKLVRKIEGNGNMKMCTYTTSVDFNYNRGDQSSLPN